MMSVSPSILIVNVRHIPLPVALRDGWDYNDVETELPKLMKHYRDTLFGYAKYELEQGRGCSYKYWSQESLDIRHALVKSSEKQPVTFDMAIDDLLIRRGNHHQCLEERHLTEGIPLTVPAECS